MLMKHTRFLTLILAACLLVPFFAPTVTAANRGAAAVSGGTVLNVDFDIVDPTPAESVGDVAVTTVRGDNKLSVAGGAEVTYATSIFRLGDAATVTFEAEKISAGSQLEIALYDDTGNSAVFLLPENFAVGTDGAFTCVLKNGSSAAQLYNSIKKQWTETAVTFTVQTSTAYKNAVRITGIGSADGTYHLDDLYVTADTPSVSVLVPEKLDEGREKELFREDYEGKKPTLSEGYTTYGTPVSVKPAADGSGNTVLDVDYSAMDWKLLASAETPDTGRRNPTGATYSDIFEMPKLSQGYTVSFDFYKVYGTTKEVLHISVYDDNNLATERGRKGFEFSTDQFESGRWYHIEITNEPGGETATGTVRDAAGSERKLDFKRVNTWGASRNNLICLVFHDKSYDVGEERQKTHFQIDNFALSTSTADPTKVQMAADASVGGAVTPMLAAYDADGKMIGRLVGNQKAMYANTHNSLAAAEYDLLPFLSTYQSAKSVKVLFWRNLTTALPYVPAVEIRDLVAADNAKTVGETAYVEVTEAMLPADGEGMYTVMMYVVPYTAEPDSIPGYVESTHTLLLVDQQDTPFTKLAYDASLYDPAKEDIVVKIHARGAEKAVTTLVEYNQPPKHTNVVIQLGEDESKLNFTWYSMSDAEGTVTYARKADMKNGAFPADAPVVTAERTDSKKSGYCANKATITDLLPDTEYCYQLTNGEDVSEIYTITTGESDAFTFAFAGDPQIGRGYGGDATQNWNCIDGDGETWGLTLSQMMNAPEFDGVDFLVSAGDQLNTYLQDYSGHELQWDAYSNHEELLSLPTVTTLGNHDNQPYAIYPFHVNLPNMLTKADGTYYGASYETTAGSYLHSGDYYFTYNSVLFICLNTNTFKDSTGTAEARAKDKAAAEDHGAFIERVMEETKDLNIDWTVAVYHHSPFGSSYHGNYTVNESTGIYNRTEQYAYSNIREYLLPILYENGVDLVLSGHDHSYTRTHILKPATDENGNYIDASVITPFENGSYVYEDGTTEPMFISWKDAAGKVHTNVRTSSKPVKVIAPDGILYVTGATSSGSQVNKVQFENPYAVVTGTAATRHLTRIDVSDNELKLTTYNMGTDDTEKITVVDTFSLLKTMPVEVPAETAEAETAQPADTSVEPDETAGEVPVDAGEKSDSSAMTMQVVSFILSALSLVCIALSMLFKGRNMHLILVLAFLSNFFMTLSYVVVDNFSGGISCGLGAIMAVINFFFSLRNKKIPKWLLVLFVLSSVSTNLIFNHSWVVILPILTAVPYVASISQENGKMYRAWSLINVCLWSAYGIITRSWGPFATNATVLCAILIGMLINDRKKAEKQ